MNTKLNAKTAIAIIIAFLLLAALGAFVWISQQRTQTRSKANASTTILFSPSSLPATVGQQQTASIILDPGTNQVNRVKLVITFDSSVIDKNSIKIVPTATKPTDPGLNTILSPFTLGSCAGNTCSASIDLGIGNNVLNAVSIRTTIATLSFTQTTASQTTIAFDTTPKTGTIVTSIGPSDFASENVLSTATPLTITGSAINPTPTGSPACSASIATCQWDALTGTNRYHFHITDGAGNPVIPDGDTDQTSVQFPASPGNTYTCTVEAVNVCGTQIAQGSPTSVTRTCPVPTASPTPLPGTTDTPTPQTTITTTPVPGATDTPAPTITPTSIPGATSTPVPTDTPTPGVLATCNQDCTVSGCASGLYCVNGVCRNPQCSDDATCGCAAPIPGATDTPTPVLIAEATNTPVPPPNATATPIPPRPTLAATGPGNIFINVGIIGGIITIIGGLLLFGL